MGGGCLREVVTQESLTAQSNPALWAPSLQIPRQQRQLSLSMGEALTFLYIQLN